MTTAATLPVASATEALIHQLEWRYATKQFDATRKLEPGLCHGLRLCRRLSQR